MSGKRVVLHLLAAVLLLSVSTEAAASRRSRPDFQIKFATLAPEGSTWMETMHAIDAEVRRRTGNRLGFRLYPGGVQGDEKEVLRKIRNGQLHGGGFTGAGLGTVAPEVRVLELPFMFESLDELDHLRDRMDGHFRSLFEEKGYLHLGWADIGFVYIFSRNPVRSAAEMTGARMWVWAGDPLAEIFFGAFGVSPIPLALPDVLTSLRTGIVDAVYGSPLACLALQWFTRVSYVTDVPITHSLGAALVSRKALRKVDPADIEILTAVARPFLRELTEKTRLQNGEAIEVMEKEGVQLLDVGEEIRAEFFETGRRAWGKGVGRLYSRELLDRVKAALEKHRSRPP